MYIKQNPTSKTEKNLAKLVLNSLIGRFGMNPFNKGDSHIYNAEEHMAAYKTKFLMETKEITENCFIDVHNNIVDRDVCENYNVNYLEALAKEKVSEAKINSSNNISITTAAAILSYARIHVAKVMLDIKRAGGNIYYTDTDSIVTDIELPPTSDGVSRVHSSELGKFKLEHIIKEKCYFIADKTYIFESDEIEEDDNGNKKNKIIKKAKAVKAKSLTFEDYEKMYKGQSILAKKTGYYRNYEGGFVNIQTSKVNLNPGNYTKRIRVIKDGR
jgi:hypothetical protein